MKHRTRQTRAAFRAAVPVVGVAFLLVAIATAYAQDADPDAKTKAPFSELKVKPSSVKFKEINLSSGGTPESKSFTLTDSGTASLTVMVGNPSSTAFTITQGAGQTVLQPKGALPVTVQFEPSAAGKFSGSIAVSSTATKGKSSASVKLAGAAKGALPPTATPSATATPTASSTATQTATATSTATSHASPTATPTPSATPSPTPTPAANSVFNLNWSDYPVDVSAFSVRSGGSLSAVAGSPFSVGASNGYNWSMSINTTGTILSGTYEPSFEVLCPGVADQSSGPLFVQTIGANGALTLGSGSPVTVDGAFVNTAGTVAVETTANLGANTTTYATYTIDQTMGALSPAGSIAEPGFSVAGQWAPSGNFFWITSIDPTSYAGSILTFSVSDSGAISLVGSPVLLPDPTNDVFFTVSENGNHLFVLSTDICKVSKGTTTWDLLSYQVSGSGALTQSGSTISLPSLNFAFFGNPNNSVLPVFTIHGSNNNLQPYAISSSNGKLTAAGSQITLLGQAGTGTFNAAGTFYYLPIPYSSSGGNLAQLEAFSVAGSGAFSPLSASPYTIGTAPIYAAIDNQNNVLYVTNSGSDSISALTINGDGSLIGVSGSPFPTGSNPVNIGLQFAGSGASNNDAHQLAAMHKLAQRAPVSTENLIRRDGPDEP